MSVHEKAALIAGGASGLGAAAVSRLLDAGYFCVVFDTNSSEAEAVKARLGERGAFVLGDITDTVSVTAALSAIGERQLEVSLCCAFKGGGRPILTRDGEPIDLDDFRRSIEINLTGTVNIMRLVAQCMARGPTNADGQRGVIINTASIAAFDGQAGQLPYAAAKAALVGLALPAARDLAPFGIRVMTIAPGTFATPAVVVLPAAYQKQLSDASLFPRRLGHPDEFARAVMSIVENPFFNAEVIRLDAGARLPAPQWRYGGGKD